MVQEIKVKVEISSKPIDQLDSQAVVFFLSENGSLFGESAGPTDQYLNGVILQSIKEGNIKGIYGETVLVATEGKIPSGKILLLGLGDLSSLTYERVTEIATTAFKTLMKIDVSNFAAFLPMLKIANNDYSRIVEKFLEGIILGLLSMVNTPEITLAIVGEEKREKEIILGVSRVKTVYRNEVKVLIVKGESEQTLIQSN